MPEILISVSYLNLSRILSFYLKKYFISHMSSILQTNSISY